MEISCELLSDFVYSFFEHNSSPVMPIAQRCCELLSDFVYSFFEHNRDWNEQMDSTVVNCFQILYIRSLNTIMPNLESLCHGL